MTINSNILDENGYIELEGNESSFLEFAYQLGTPIKSRVNGSLIDELVPKDQEEAHKNSLSKIYGTGSFPYHTDGAYFQIPPKYVVLRFKNGIDKPTPTRVFDTRNFRNKDRDFMMNDVWSVKGRSNSFYSTILSKTVIDGEEIFRIDPGCMSPIDKSINSMVYMEEFTIGSSFIDIQWKPNKIVILNNWKMVHSRPVIQIQECNNRVIQRLMVNGRI